MFFHERKRFHKIRHNDKLREFLHPVVALAHKKDYTSLIDRRMQCCTERMAGSYEGTDAALSAGTDDSGL